MGGRDGGGGRELVNCSSGRRIQSLAYSVWLRLKSSEKGKRILLKRAPISQTQIDDYN